MRGGYRRAALQGCGARGGGARGAAPGRYRSIRGRAMKAVYLFGQCGQRERREEHQTQPAHLLGLVAALEQRQLHEFLGA